MDGLVIRIVVASMRGFVRTQRNKDTLIEMDAKLKLNQLRLGFRFYRFRRNVIAEGRTDWLTA